MSKELFDFLYGNDISKKDMFKLISYQKKVILDSNNLHDLTDEFKYKLCNGVELSAIDKIFDIEMKYFHKPDEITVSEMKNIFINIMETVGYISWPRFNEYGRVVEGKGSWLP